MVVSVIDGTHFEEFISPGPVAVVDFYADWCMPCRIMGPRLEELSKELNGVTFGRLDVDENGDIAQRFGIVSIPTLIVFRDGKQVDEIIGARSKEIVKEIIEKYL